MPKLPKPPPKVNKAAYIRSFPLTYTAAQVVAKGAEAGISFSVPHVYTVRRMVRVYAGWAFRRAAKEVLIRSAVEIGFARAEELLAQLHT